MTGVRDDGFEVLDTDDNVHLLSSSEVLEVCSAERDGSLKGLLEYFYRTVSMAVRRWETCIWPAFAITDLLGEACIRDPPILGIDVQLLCPGAEVLYCLFKG